MSACGLEKMTFGTGIILMKTWCCGVLNMRQQDIMAATR